MYNGVGSVETGRVEEPPVPVARHSALCTMGIRSLSVVVGGASHRRLIGMISAPEPNEAGTVQYTNLLASVCCPPFNMDNGEIPELKVAPTLAKVARNLKGLISKDRKGLAVYLSDVLMSLYVYIFAISTSRVADPHESRTFKSLPPKSFRRCQHSHKK